MESDIPIEKRDVGIICLRTRSQKFQDIVMCLHGFLDEFTESVLFGESTRGCHERHIVCRVAFDLLFVV